MSRYIVRRLLAMPLLLFSIITVAFILSHATKANPLASIISERQMSNEEIVAAVKARWGLDKSLQEQYLIYLKNLLSGDMRTSFRTKRSVAENLLDRLPATLELTFAAIVFGTAMGITLGVFAAKFRDHPVDHGARLVALLGSSLPVFWSGLIVLYLFSVQLDWLPGPGRLDTRSVAPPYVTGMFTIDTLLAGDLAKFGEALRHLLLPSMVLGWAVMGIISRLVRASMLDVPNQDYILIARTKDANEARALLNHAFRNALIPALTIVGFSFAYLITGAVLTETIFSWPGIGSYAVESARTLDYPAISGVTIVGGSAFLLANLTTDIAYAMANPKIKFT
jgi:peptide/nickel transport system permease protein